MILIGGKKDANDMNIFLIDLPSRINGSQKSNWRRRSMQMLP